MNPIRIEFDIKDIERMYKTLEKAGASPMKAVNKGTSKAATVVRRAVKAGAPGERIRKNISTRTEKTKVKGKKVREITFKGGDDANEELQLKINNPGRFGGKSKKGYLPASQEYGWLTGNGAGGVKFIPGKHFMREAADSTANQARQVMIETITKELEEIWKSTK